MADALAPISGRAKLGTVPTPDPTVAALVDGDSSGWKALYLAHRDVMYAAAHRVLDNKADTEEAVQETMASVMTAGAEKLRDIERVGSYLARIAHNKAVDIIRARSRTTSTDPDTIDLMDDTMIDVEDVATDNLAMDIGLGLLSEMPEKVAYAHRERVLKGRKAKDVAAELGCDPSYISDLVRQAAAYITDHSPFIAQPNPDRSITGTTGTEDPT